MTRRARQISQSGLYHIIFRGLNVYVPFVASEWKTGMYGSGRDFVKAMGGDVKQQGDSSVYDLSIGTVSFSINTGTIGAYGKVKASNGATIQYTIVDDGNGNSKTLINLQDGVNAAAKSGYDGTFAWDLGDKGGVLIRGSQRDTYNPITVGCAKVMTADGISNMIMEMGYANKINYSMSIQDIESIFYNMKQDMTVASFQMQTDAKRLQDAIDANNKFIHFTEKNIFDDGSWEGYGQNIVPVNGSSIGIFKYGYIN